jgi:hypothetical protein
MLPIVEGKMPSTSLSPQTNETMAVASVSFCRSYLYRKDSPLMPNRRLTR